MSMVSNTDTVDGHTESSVKTTSVDDSRSRTRRDRKGLLLFLALVAAGGIAIAAYFITGRGWTVAATIVDENIGNMGSYTVVVFNGSGERDPDEMKETATIYHEELPAADLSDGLVTFDENGEIAYANLGDRIMSVFHRAMAKFRMEDATALYASDVRDLYETSGADVCTLSINDLDRYSEGAVYSLDNRSIGVFSISAYTPRAKMSRISKNLRDHGAGTIICITSSLSMISDRDAADIVIVTSHSLSEDESETSDSMVIEIPYDEEVGIILISSNGVPYYKSISEL